MDYKKILQNLAYRLKVTSKDDPEYNNALRLYETAPVKKVTGFFEWNDFEAIVFTADFNNIFTTAQNVVDAGCVPLEDLKKYIGDRIDLFGWKIKNPQKYKEPLPLSFFNFERPPQSWCYDWSDLPF